MPDITAHEKQVFREAIETYGEAQQLIVLFEEMSELQKEICKCIRYSVTHRRRHVEEEMADVLIMLDQARMILELDDDNIEMWRLDKVARLQQRLEDEKNGGKRHYSKAID